MTRFVKPLALAAALCLPALAAAQAMTLVERARGAPVGLSVTPEGAASAEEPTALSVNPAGPGFVGGAALEYFHEQGSHRGFLGDGFWASAPLGPLVPTLSMEWVRPGDGGGPRYRKTGLGLAFSPTPTFSLGLAWNHFSSPDPARDALRSLDVGLTLRPARWLSLGAAAQGLQAREAGRPLPIRYDLGAATRFAKDTVTLSADLLAGDQGKDAFHVTHGSLGLRADFTGGYAVQAQVLLPLREAAGIEGAAVAQLALSASTPHFGVSSGGALTSEEPGRAWNVGARLSAERYRGLSTLEHTVPVIKLSKALARSRSLLLPLPRRDPYGQLLARLDAVRDDETPALLLEIDELPVGAGRVEELRHKLEEVRARKPVVAWISGGGNRGYWLATAASTVWAPPAGSVQVNGLASNSPFLREGLARLGVSFDVVAIGRFKNAPDALTRADMSEAQREVTGAILDDLYRRQVQAVAAARSLPEARVRELVDVGFFTTEQAVEAKLVDAAVWPDELEARLGSQLGKPVSLAEDDDQSPPRQAQRWGSRPAVAVIRLEGTITSGPSRLDPLLDAMAGADTVARQLRAAADDGDVKAIVLRIDSPGGDALASDLIWRAVVAARRRGKPVVASMGDTAASGGYLAAVGAGDVLAEPSTFTGSIGVFALKPDLSGLLGKLGVRDVVLQRGANADIESPLKTWTPGERKLVEQQIAAFYETFLARVAEGRKLTRDEVHAVAQGRVWTGAQALERKLVDRLGTLDDAVALAKLRAGYAPDEDLEVRRVEPAVGLLERLSSAIAQSREEPALLKLALGIPEIRAAALLSEMGPLLALPLDWLDGAPLRP
ncbi:MAG TPA: signal peptide peptidase SppA [Anaeromyxobacteraceae bacterium]|jgi:protease-4|nr:signal peptide peptidase SppA [Anaeromyxobacteraceae bacterium]